MKKRRFSKTARLLLALGALMQVAAFLAFQAGGALLEYAICAPDVQKIDSSASGGESAPARIETGLEALMKARDDVESQLSDGLAALACGGMKSGASVSGDGGDAVATLQAVDRCWLETCPRQLGAGRWMDSSELKSGAKVAVLDADLAFKLFGSESAVDRKLRIGEAEFRVVGTVRHRRGVGERDEYSAYIPLAAAAKQGLQLDTLTMYALPLSQSGLDQSFTSAMEAAWGPGSFYNLRKEAMGALLLTRVILFAFGMAVMARLAKGLRALARRFGAEMREMRARGYARSYLAPSAARILALAACAALLLAATYALLSFVVEPVYTFTEWVPESLVEISALKAVFWSRTADAARLVRVITPDAARASFWGGIARLGAVLFLLGCALGRGREKKMKKLTGSGNQTGAAVV